MKIGIIGAMDHEIDILKDALENRKETAVGKMVFYEGTAGGKDAVVVRCGIGKIAAAVCAEILIGRFGVTHLINTGIAGSLNATIDIGDAVVSTDAVHHDFDLVNFGYPYGEVPGIGSVGIPADEQLRRLCAEAIRTAAPEISVLEGRIASGDQFIRTKEKKEWIRNEFGAECCEMEGASIAQTAFMNNIPYVIIRMISDKADESSEMTYEQFVEYQKRYEADLAKKAPSSWAADTAKKAILSGLFNDGDGDGILDNPQAPLTREQFVAVLDRAGILSAQDRFIARFEDLPDWAKSFMREILDDEIINGGTDKALDSQDINM